VQAHNLSNESNVVHFLPLVVMLDRKSVLIGFDSTFVHITIGWPPDNAVNHALTHVCSQTLTSSLHGEVHRVQSIHHQRGKGRKRLHFFFQNEKSVEWAGWLGGGRSLGQESTDPGEHLFKKPILSCI